MNTSTTLSAHDAATMPIEGNPARPVVWWAWIGAGFLLLQLYLFGAWILSDKFVASDPGPDQLTAFGVTMKWVISTIFAGCGIAGVLWLLSTLVRGQRFSGFQVMMLALWTCNWQDPLINAFRPTFLYNMHYLNRGSWTELAPWWLSPYGSKMPEPLLWNIGCYVAMVPIWVGVTLWTLRKIKALWPRLSNPQLLLAAFLAVSFFDTVNEVIMVRGEVFAYAGVIRAWSLFPGTQYQYPLYEGPLWMMGMTACAALLYFADDKGRTWCERSVETLKLSTMKENFLRVLAVGGYVNLWLFLYIIFQMIISMYVDPYPQLPSYFTHGVCGLDIHYPCPDPSLPIKTIHSLGQ